MEYIIINSRELIWSFINQRRYNEISIDIEGDDLCRYGRINTIQLFVPTNNRFFLFDCSKLSVDEVRNALFHVLDDRNIVKYFFDCRSDVDALYHQYGLVVTNVIDVQLYEMAYRKVNRIGSPYHYSSLYRTLCNYSSCIQISGDELHIKDKFSKQFKSNNYFMDLHDVDVLRYMLIDVLYLHKLFYALSSSAGGGKVYHSILKETKRRVDIWKNPTFFKGKSNALSAI